MSFEIKQADKPSQEQLQVLLKGLEEDDRSKVGENDMRELTFFLHDDRGNIVGGVNGNYGNFGWLWVGTLWVANELRGQGYASKLMDCIEQEAFAQGCKHAYLNSATFQAVGFYQKRGYSVYAELEDFPPGHSVCSLRKNLS